MSMKHKMLRVFIAVTKFHCHRLARWAVKVAQNILMRMTKAIRPKVKVLAAVKDGRDATVEVIELVAENNDIGMNNMPGDIIGSAEKLTILLNDGNVVFVGSNGGKCVTEKSEDAIGTWDNINALSDEK